MLFADQIMPQVQRNFVLNVEAYAHDKLYGTSNCTMTLDALLAQMVLMMVVNNNTCGSTPAQIQCALSLLNQNTSC